MTNLVYRVIEGIIYLVGFRYGLKPLCCTRVYSNIWDIKAGVSLHKSPFERSLRLKWKAFVTTHRAQVNPDGSFMVCSDHFSQDCFKRSFYLQGFRRLKQGSIPTIWQKSEKTVEEHVSKRNRRMISNTWSTFVFR